jgi:hypothetical protein
MNITNAPDKIATGIKLNAYNVLDFLKATHNTNMQLVWDNQEATPAEILNSLGKDAGDIFRLSSELTKFILSVDPTFQPKLPLQDYILHADGRVEIAALPSPSPAE